MLLVRTANAVVDLDIEGAAQLALVKDVQRDPVRQIIEHIDLVVLRRGEKVTVDVPVVIEGESFSGTIHVQDLNTVSLLVLATVLGLLPRVLLDVIEPAARAVNDLVAR